jgi:hypothetical protein
MVNAVKRDKIALSVNKLRIGRHMVTHIHTHRHTPTHTYPYLEANHCKRLVHHPRYRSHVLILGPVQQKPKREDKVLLVVHDGGG